MFDNKTTLLANGVHPSIIDTYLTMEDGSVRMPEFEEWTEDFGLGYKNRLAWEEARKFRVGE